MGSLKGAICTNSTSLPGRHPISNNLRGTLSSSNETIIAFSPRLSKLSEVVNLFRLNLNKAKVNENQ